MNGFSIFGGNPGPGLQPSHERVGSRYVDPKPRKHVAPAPASFVSGPAPIKRLRAKTHPPQRPLVSMAKERDNLFFREIATKVVFTEKTTPAEATEAIKSAFICARISKVEIHNCRPNAVMFRLTLRTPAGYSRFEGTPMQFKESFKPIESK